MSASVKSSRSWPSPAVHGLPGNRTSIGAALVDTANEVSSGVGLGVAGTVLAALFTGTVASRPWSTLQVAEFREAVTISGGVLTVAAAVFVGWAMLRTRRRGLEDVSVTQAAPATPARGRCGRGCGAAGTGAPASRGTP